MSKLDSISNDTFDIRPGMEQLTPDELEAFLARARAQGRTLTSEEQYAIFGPPPEDEEPVAQYADIEEMEAAQLNAEQLAELQHDFFSELENVVLPDIPMVWGIIFDFDHTLAYPERSLDELMEQGAREAEAYMRSTGMTFPDEFWNNIIEARRFAAKKSADENEEHIADDAMSFLLQFFGYPASKMDPEVLRRAVDIFYAPEMTAWQLRPGVIEAIQALHREGYKLAVLANYGCDRVFQRTIDYTGIRSYLDICLCSASVEYRKPDEKFFNIVLERWGALPHEVVVVGDSLVHDIQGGMEVGTLTVQTCFDTDTQVIHDNAQVASEVQADATIARFEQLPALIHAWTYPE